MISCIYSKRHNKFLLPVPAKAIYGSFCRTENEIFNVVNYKSAFHRILCEGAMQLACMCGLYTCTVFQKTFVAGKTGGASLNGNRSIQQKDAANAR